MTQPQFGRIPYGLVRDGVVARLKNRELRVLFGLCAHLNGRGDTSTVSAARLAFELGLHPRTVRRGLRALHDSRIIVTIKRPGRSGIHHIHGGADHQLTMFGPRTTAAPGSPRTSDTSGPRSNGPSCPEGRTELRPEPRTLAAHHSERTDKKQSASPAALASDGPPAATLKQSDGKQRDAYVCTPDPAVLRAGIKLYRKEHPFTGAVKKAAPTPVKAVKEPAPVLPTDNQRKLSALVGKHTA